MILSALHGESTKKTCNEEEAGIYCPLPSNMEYTETIKRKTHFINATKGSKKALDKKKALKLFMIQSGKPDSLQIEELTEEIFDLREQLILQAMEVGLPLQIANKIIDEKTMGQEICSKEQQGKE
ncbi:MAG: hypothetical protein D3924_06295 [Candidatus Electrothrix sp. AR4]|nr:hypothetical protein [Candidatus Electrothrix sp. AR4]